MIGIVVPMPSERKPLERALGRRRGDVRIEQSGIGPARAATATARLLDSGGIERVVVCGIAGGIPGVTSVGDLVCPAVVEDAATGDRFDATPVDGLEVCGLLRTGDVDSYATTAPEVEALRAAGVVAVDMETAAVARACAERGIPWVAFRAISDLVGDPSLGEPVMALVNADGSPRPRAAVAYFLTHPSRIPRMLRLWRDATVAARKAATVTASFCRQQ